MKAKTDAQLRGLLATIQQHRLALIEKTADCYRAKQITFSSAHDILQQLYVESEMLMGILGERRTWLRHQRERLQREQGKRS